MFSFLLQSAEAAARPQTELAGPSGVTPTRAGRGTPQDPSDEGETSDGASLLNVSHHASTESRASHVGHSRGAIPRKGQKRESPKGTQGGQATTDTLEGVSKKICCSSK